MNIQKVLPVSGGYSSYTAEPQKTVNDENLAVKNLKEEKVSKKELNKVVEQLNAVYKTFHRSIRFKLHEASGRIQVNVVNTDKDKVIRQIPPDTILNMVAKLKKYVGVLLDEKR